MSLRFPGENAEYGTGGGFEFSSVSVSTAVVSVAAFWASILPPCSSAVAMGDDISIVNDQSLNIVSLMQEYLAMPLLLFLATYHSPV